MVAAESRSASSLRAGTEVLMVGGAGADDCRRQCGQRCSRRFEKSRDLSAVIGREQVSHRATAAL